MDYRRFFPGHANPRARPFVGRRVILTRLHQLFGAKLGQRLAGKNDGALRDFPPLLQLQTITGCNASCRICPQRRIRSLFPEEKMSDGLYDAIVEQCRDQAGLRGVGFVLQNEPLTDPTLFDKIRHFRERVDTPAMTFIATNGTLLTPPVADVLLASGLDAMHISCNGFGKEDFDAVNEGKSWEEFRDNLENFLARDLSRIAVLLSFVRGRFYRAELEQAVRYWRSRGIKSFIHGMNNRGGMVEDYERYGLPLKKDAWRVRLRKLFIRRLLGCCPYPFLQMSVLASGKALICTHDWARRHVIGDLNRQSIREVWDGPEMRDIRLKLINGRMNELPACRRCDVFTNAAFA